MSATVVDPVLERRLRHLQAANRTRMDRAVLKRQIACGEVSVAGVLADIPACALSWRLGELIAAQHRWGVARARRFLARAGVSELRVLGALTDRQRRVLTRLLEPYGGA